MTEGGLLLLFCGSLFLTFLAATIVLTFFSKDEISQLGGHYAVKPMVIYVFGYFTWLYFEANWNSEISWILWLAAHFILEVLIFFLIIFWFRDRYRIADKNPWLFAGFDLFRWGSLLILVSNSGPEFSKINFYEAVVFFFELTLFPTLFSAVTLIIAVLRHKKLRVA